MYTAQFEYHRPDTMVDALMLLNSYGDEAKLLAGGHSLIPLLKLRFAQPGHLIDIRRLDDLRGISLAGTVLTIGAATTHAEIARSSEVRARLPVLAETAALIGDPQVRNLGTIGGSLAHADPSADLPAVLLALDGEILLARATGARTVKAKDFFIGLLTTAMQPGELMTAVRFPVPQGKTGAAYEKHAHPASRYAVVGIAAVVTLADDGTIERARIAITGAGTHVVRATAVETALAGKAPTASALAGAAQAAPDGIDLRSDAQGPAEYKAQLVRVRTARALERAAQRALTA